MNKMRIYAYKILPLVYDQSLSYYEVLCKVVAKLNELIDYVDKSLMEKITEMVSKLIIDEAYDAETETLTITIDIGE